MHCTVMAWCEVYRRVAELVVQVWCIIVMRGDRCAGSV